MRYNEETGYIETNAKEIVSISRRGISPTLVYDEDEPLVRDTTRLTLNSIVGKCEETSVHFDFDIGEYHFSVLAKANDIEGERITVAREISSMGGKPTKDESTAVRAEAFITAYAYAKIQGLDSVLLRIVYINPINLAYTVNEEKVKAPKLELFFNKCIKEIAVFAKPEIERVTERLRTMRNAKFPYNTVREGQSEFIRQAYRTLSRGGTLYASAPTGTGKTVSALYPAIRALGDGRCDKVFYLTPKSTTSEAVRDCISVMGEKGIKIKCIILTAKDKCCVGNRVCKRSRKDCPYSLANRLCEAVLALYDSGKAVVDSSDFVEYGKKYTVCPYELSLCYAELCDVVVCDFNHLFDPTVYIRRFFTEGGRYAFLVDEAHNLAPRAREMYSAEIDSDVLLEPSECELLGAFSVIKRQSAEACRVFNEELMLLLRDEIRESRDGRMVGAVAVSEIPARIYELFDEFISSLDGEIRMNLIAKDSESEARLRYLRTYYYKIKKFTDILKRFDESYKLFLFYDSGKIRAVLYCLDTSPAIRERLNKGHGAVLFSATLSPISYYRSILGGERSDDVIEVESPFDPSQLSVTVMDKISTRYSEREDTLDAVCRVVAATVSARRGHYMVFTPSFEYAEALMRRFSAKYPKVKTLLQTKDMTAENKDAFLKGLKDSGGGYLIAFCVMGGIYSEGIDLAGDSLIGAVIVGIGIPQISYEREALAEYYEEKYEMGKQYAYIYPGMNRVFQAAGRVIRREDDRGVIVLIDDRFDDPIYKKSLPSLWGGVKFIADAKRLRELLDEFWRGVDEEKAHECDSR